ncbi:F-box only protein 27 isoform X2 [Fukomys damarensis]|uniref:F-box only protein 27 isoform X2 n=1 Tax=Fukomys damarensis TaxID=885580 RepID=UPI00053F8B4B|nr:F-box only protein 27 isoform X2 [Fukomys damarensis]
MVQHGGDGWVVEENRTTVPGAPSQTCFVASFRWCRKKQVLDLEKEGLWPELLDSGKIEICVSDWWGARHDSGCKYRLFVKLLDATQTVLDKFSAVPDPIEQWNNDICLQEVTWQKLLISTAFLAMHTHPHSRARELEPQSRKMLEHVCSMEMMWLPSLGNAV